MRRTLSSFPGVVRAEVDLQKQQARLQVRPSFDQYLPLEAAIQEGGGAIRMFHTRYLVPQPLYVCLGVKDHAPDKLGRLEQQLNGIPGVRAASIDEQRWFTNEQGLDIGGAVIFTDPDPRLEKRLEETAGEAGFILEPRMDGPGAMRQKEMSELNHRIAGLFLLFLTGLGVLHVVSPQSRRGVRYGTLGAWMGLFVFLLLRADPEYWPAGPIHWLEGFRDTETFQHRVGIGLLIPVIAWELLSLRHGWKLNGALLGWGLLALGVVGGGLLFTHRHITIEPAHAAMVRRMNAEHMAMAASVLGLGVSKFFWDRWKVPGRWGEYLWLVCMGLLGLTLNLYVE